MTRSVNEAVGCATSGEARTAAPFSDGAAYERFMGPWTRAVGPLFLTWLTIPAGQRWVDVGCGTGVFTEVILDSTSPAIVCAIDPAAAQIDQARTNPVAQRADFRLADAQALPFANAEFDVAASAFVINFIPDRQRAMAEMKRVVKVDGCVAGCVWDFAGDLGVSRHVLAELREMNARLPPIPGIAATRIDALAELFERARLTDVATRVMKAEVTYPDFAAYWRRFIQNPTPSSAYIKGLSQPVRSALRERVQARLAARSIWILSRPNEKQPTSLG